MNNLKRAVSGIRIQGAVAVVVALVLIALPLVVDLGDYVLRLAVSLLIYVTLSESWNLMGGYAGQVNLGLSAYLGSGALCYALVYKAGAPWYLALVVGGMAATVVACIIGPPTLRLKGAYFGIGTMALAAVMRLITSTIFIQAIFPPRSYWLTFSVTKSYYIALAVALATIVVVYVVVHSRLGLVLQAIRDDEDAANASGINPAKYKMIVFIISSFLAGVAGGVYSYSTGNLHVPQQFGMDWTIGAIVAVTIGGWGTLIGPILGSIVFVIPKEVLGHTAVRDWYLVVTGAIFILVIMFLPDGLTSTGAMIRSFFASVKGKPKTSLSK